MMDTDKEIDDSISCILTSRKIAINNASVVISDNEYIKYSTYDGKTSIVINGTNFYDNSFYIWKGKIHDLSRMHYDAEFIIECVNGNQKVFVCFPLKHQYGLSNTFIDNLWNQRDTIADIGSLLGHSSNSIYFKDGINTVIVYLKPINISTNLKSRLPNPKCFIVPRFSHNFSVIKMEVINKSETAKNTPKTLQESFFSYFDGVESFENLISIDANGNITGISSEFTGISQVDLASNGLFLDCAPTSQSTETLPALTIPLDKNGNINLSNSLMFSSIMNSLILFILISFVFMTLPTVYKYTIVDVIAKFNVPDKATRLTTVSYFICTVIFIFSVSLICDGMIHSNMYEAYTGIFIGLMLAVGIGRTYFLKNNKDYSFPIVYNWSPQDLFVLLKDAYDFSVDNSGTVGLIYFVLTFILILCFLVPALVSSKVFIPSADTKTHVVAVILGMGFSFNLILAPFLALLNKAYR
jgi:hypothetical protein